MGVGKKPPTMKIHEFQCSKTKAKMSFQINSALLYVDNDTTEIWLEDQIPFWEFGVRPYYQG